MKLRTPGLAALVLAMAVSAVTLATLAPAIAAPAAIAHLSHRAFYEISIGRVSSGADVVDASGGMVVEWARDCEGWASTQRLVMTMSQSSGAQLDSSVSLSTYETSDGTRFQFEGRTTLAGQTVEEVRGTAERPGPGQPGLATYRKPEGLEIALPPDTLFPFEHTIYVLEAAERGESPDYAHYFDGSQPELAPMGASALVLGEARAAGEGAADAVPEAFRAPWWPVRLAWFAAGDTAEQPEFEMSQIIQANGVVRRFEFDYGEFIIIADLVRVEEIEAPTCR